VLLIAVLLIYVIYAFMLVLLIRVIFSYISPSPTNPVSRFAYALTEPMLAPIRRRLPPVAGMDLSPVVLWLAALFVVAALRSIG
jgi:YggT family protein